MSDATKSMHKNVKSRNSEEKHFQRLLTPTKSEKEAAKKWWRNGVITTATNEETRLLSKLQ